MKNISYTKTPALNQELQKIEELRRDLILKPLSPREELRLQWLAMINYIHYLLGLSGNIILPEHINKLLSPEGKKQLTPKEKEVTQIKNTLDYLYHYWLVNPEPVTAKSLIDLYQSAFSGSLKISEKELNNTLRYIQINPESPIIQAALAQFMIFDLYPFSEQNEIFAHLVFLMFLYKAGYDFKRMVTLEEYFFHDMAHYKDLITKLKRQTNMTEWLEYVTISLVYQLGKVIKTIDTEKQSPSLLPDTFELNDRQKAILKYMEQPGTKINNTVVQKLHKVSQITASRDLAKLTSLGLLFPLGKGRSTYYTKV